MTDRINIKINLYSKRVIRDYLVKHCLTESRKLFLNHSKKTIS